MSNKLVDGFLAAVGKPSVVIVTVPELGKVGVRTSMLLGERSAFYTERQKDTANALLLQKTICDPETQELVLSGLTLDQINSLPTHVVDPLLDHAFISIGLKKADLDTAVDNILKKESEELKNSENDQN